MVGCWLLVVGLFVCLFCYCEVHLHLSCLLASHRRHCFELVCGNEACRACSIFRLAACDTGRELAQVGGTLVKDMRVGADLSDVLQVHSRKGKQTVLLVVHILARDEHSGLSWQREESSKKKNCKTKESKMTRK